MSKIRSVEAFPLRLRSASGAPRYRTGAGVRSVYPTSEELLLVRIASDDHVAWGEALAPVVPEAPAAIIEHLIRPLLIGSDVSPPRPTTFRLQESMRERGHLNGHHADAVAAIDIALWDLWGKTVGLPVHDLLGGAHRRQIPVYHTQIGGERPEERAEHAAEAIRSGLSRMKLHLPHEPREALAHLDAVLEAVAALSDGPSPAQVAVDAHWVHDQGSARRLGRALDERGVWFFEAPLPPEDIEGHRRLAEHLSTPIAVGEAMRHRFEYAVWASEGALMIAQPDIGRTGISEATTIADTLAAHHFPIAPHHSLATGVAFAAALHVSAVAERYLAMEYAPAIAERAEGVIEAPFFATGALSDGALQVPDLPGLGVVVDEDRVRDHAVRARSLRAE